MKIKHDLRKKYINSFEWHKWYAWYPVSDGDTTVWLEEVWRKRGSCWGEIYWKYNFDIECPK